MCRLCVNLTYRQTKAVLVIYPYFTASHLRMGYIHMLSSVPGHDGSLYRTVKHRRRDVNARETREGWLLLTVETEVNGDSKSTKEKRGPSLVGSYGLSCWYKRFLFRLGCSSRPSTKYFFLTVVYTFSIPLSPSPSKPGRQPCWVACLLVCVSGQCPANLLFVDSIRYRIYVL